MCFAVWFDPKVSVNRLAEVFFFFWWGQWKSWQDKYKSELRVTCWALFGRATKTLMQEFLDPLAQHQNNVPRGDQYAHWGSKWDGGHMVSHSDWALEHAGSDFSFAHLFWAVSLLHPHSGNRWHQRCAHTAQIYCHAHWNYCKINGQIF